MSVGNECEEKRDFKKINKKVQKINKKSRIYKYCCDLGCALIGYNWDKRKTVLLFYKNNFIILIFNFYLL